MGFISPTDSVFLLSESREHPTHVGGMQLFELPPNAGDDFVRDLFEELLTYNHVRSTFRKRPADPVDSVGLLRWTDDQDIDLEAHVRLAALPKPNRIRELFEYVSRNHSALLDRHRPLWEFHLIEGVEDNGFALYLKVHHSIVDGVAATRLAAGALTEDPQDTAPPIWADSARRPRSVPPPRSLGATVKGLADYARSVPAAGLSLSRILAAGYGRRAGTLPLPAPRTMFNVPITGSRRFAAQTWSVERMKAAGRKAGGATLNDVLLAMSAGALRRYLQAAGELPDKPLVAAVPVSVRTDDSAEGNAVGFALCNLATNIADPVERLHTIVASMNDAKSKLAKHTSLQVQLMGTVMLGSQIVMGAVPGMGRMLPPVANIVISNVPGPRTPLYLNGARMTGSYPASIVTDYQGLNITAVSYADNLDIGITGCRRSVPRLQRLLDYLEESLAELE